MTNDEFCDLADALYAALRRYQADMLAAAPAVPQADALPVALVRAYNAGYMAGHHDTVEGGFVDIHPSDMDTYHADVVAELGLPAVPPLPAKWTERHTSAQVWIESDDFTHDLRLYVSGTIESDDQRVAYAQEIARRLNAALGEPVAEVNDRYSRDGYNDEISVLLPVGTKLYTQPAAPQAEPIDPHMIVADDRFPDAQAEPKREPLSDERIIEIQRAAYERAAQECDEWAKHCQATIGGPLGAYREGKADAASTLAERIRALGGQR